MVDAFERANTLTFTVVAEVRGVLTHSEIESALRKLEKRHPLLRAQVVRDGDEVSFSQGDGIAIPLTIETGDETRLQSLAASSIDHRAWPDAGPRAELTWLRLADDQSALLLSLHHLVSDGSSGMFAMRDLLAMIAAPDERTEKLESSGLTPFLPTGHGGMRDRARAVALVAKAMAGKTPQRLRAVGCAPAERKTLLATVALSEVESARLIARARRDGVTVHGVLCAALSLAIAAERGGVMQQRILHPVDLRRYLRARYPEQRSIGDCVGYYVTSVETDHQLDSRASLPNLARAISDAVREGKALGEPLLTAPLLGPWLVRATRRMAPERFCKLAERDVMLATYSLTNLGPLEALGLRSEVGSLSVDSVWFVAASSVLTALGAAATTFNGRIQLNITGATPLVPRALFESLAPSVHAALVGYAHQR